MRLENLDVNYIKYKMKKINKKSKRGQLKIQEMAFMLVGVVLFFGLVALFVLTIVYKNMYNQVNIINQEKTLTSLINLADSPEFRCVTTKSNCIDGDKVISLMNKTAYVNFWPFSSLKVIRMSGFNKDEAEMTQCNLANYANVNCKGGSTIPVDEQSSSDTSESSSTSSSGSIIAPRTCSPDCDIIDIYDKKVKGERVISSYVALCRKEYEKVDTYTGYTYDKCEIAKLIAGTELKNLPGEASKAG